MRESLHELRRKMKEKQAAQHRAAVDAAIKSEFKEARGSPEAWEQYRQRNRDWARSVGVAVED